MRGSFGEHGTSRSDRLNLQEVYIFFQSINASFVECGTYLSLKNRKTPSFVFCFNGFLLLLFLQWAFVQLINV